MFLFVFFSKVFLQACSVLCFFFPIAEFSASLPEFFLFCWFLACESKEKPIPFEVPLSN